MSLFSPSRCVLILGDEGLQIYNITNFGTKFIDFVPWDTVDFESGVSTLLVKKCRRKPVVVLNDMVEQHYRKERIPKVSIMDRANVLKRRLSVAFPNYKVRAALKLSDKKQLTSEKGKGSVYLFAAIPNSDPFNKTLEAIRQSRSPIVGFYLLPVEASSMVKILSDKYAKNKRYKSVWNIFIGQHSNGGLRQIVTRNGELALTRMTPIVDTDVEPELWAKEVAGELNATMSYLSRFGYQDTDGLDVSIIANESSEISLESAIDVDCNLNIVNAQQAANALGARLGRQEDLRYADALHAAYLGQKKKFLLPMQAPAIHRLTQPRRVASLLMIGLLLGCAYFGFNAFQKLGKALKLNDDLTVAIQQNSSLRQEYARELANKKALGFDFALVNNSIEIFKSLENKKLKPLPVIREIGRSLGADLHLDHLAVKLDTVEKKNDINQYNDNPDNPDNPDGQQVAKKKYMLNAVMTISFPSSVSPDVGVEKVNNLQQRLQENLPDYEVNIIKQVADLSYTGNFVGEAGTSSVEVDSPDSYDAEIQIRGDVQ